METKKKQFTNVVVLEFLKRFSSELYLIALPAIAVSLETHHSNVQKLITFFFLGVAVAQFFAGPWSDLVGRRKVLLTLLPAFVIGSLICTIGNLLFLYIGIFIVGLGIGCAPAVGKAIIYDTYKRTKALTYIFVILSAIVVWAPAIAMVIGGHIASAFDWRFIFILSALIGLFAFMLTYFMLHESIKRKKSEFTFKQLMRHYWQVIANKTILLMLVALGLFSSGAVAFYTASIFIFSHTLKIPLHWIGYIAVFLVVSDVLGRFLASRIVTKIGRPRVILLGASVSVISMLIKLFLTNLLPVSIFTSLLPMLFYMLGLGATIPSARILLFERVPKQIASCSSLLEISMSLFGALAAYFVSHFHIESAAPLSMYLLVLCTVALLSILLFNYRSKYDSLR